MREPPLRRNEESRGETTASSASPGRSLATTPPPSACASDDNPAEAQGQQPAHSRPPLPPRPRRDGAGDPVDKESLDGLDNLDGLDGLGLSGSDAESDDFASDLLAPGPSGRGPPHAGVVAVDDDVPVVFHPQSSPGTTRVFLASGVSRSRRGHRAMVAVTGAIVEIEGLPLDGVPSVPPKRRTLSRGALLGEAPARARVARSGVSLTVRFEPPSPKFHQKHPGMLSFRVALTEQGSDSAFLVRASFSFECTLPPASPTPLATLAPSTM